MNRWYVVHTHPNGERVAADNLTRQGFQAYLPQYLKRRSHARKVELAPRPLFPRYLFVRLDTEAQQWRPVRSTYGVAGLVSQGDMPLAVPEGVVEAIQAGADEAGYVALDGCPSLKSGDAVRVVDGVFAELVGEFVRLTDDQRVVVLLNLLGRRMHVRLPAEAVVAAP